MFACFALFECLFGIHLLDFQYIYSLSAISAASLFNQALSACNIISRCCAFDPGDDRFRLGHARGVSFLSEQHLADLHKRFLGVMVCHLLRVSDGCTDNSLRRTRSTYARFQRTNNLQCLANTVSEYVNQNTNNTQFHPRGNYTMPKDLSLNRVST